MEYNKKYLQIEEIKAIFEKEYKTEFARRLDIIMEMINYNKNANDLKINLVGIAKRLELESEQELKKYYLIQEEPKFELIDRIASEFNINEKWLSGENSNSGPFYDSDFNDRYKAAYLKAQAFYDECSIKDVDYLFAINNLERFPELIIIRKINDFKYETCRESCILFHSNESTGDGKLIATHKLLKKMVKNERIDGCSICILNDDMYDELKNGYIFPGIVEKYRDNELKFLIVEFVELKQNKKYGDAINNAIKYLKDEIKH